MKKKKKKKKKKEEEKRRRRKRRDGGERVGKAVEVLETASGRAGAAAVVGRQNNFTIATESSKKRPYL